VDHTKESNAEAFWISKSEASITLQKGQISLCFTPVSYKFGLHNPKTIRVVRIMKSELHQFVLVGGMHHKKHVFKGFYQH